MKGYKGFNKNLICRNLKYEIGNTYEMEEYPIICKRGFHFCKELENVFNYYTLCKDHKFCEIEAYEDIIADHYDYGKYCTNKIKIIRELSLDEILDILNIKDRDLFKKYYNDNNFNDDQMYYIYLGFKEGLDVSIYAKPEFDHYQMNYIYLGLKEGLDVSIYAKPEFNPYQMNQIMVGLEEGLDVSIYAKPEFNNHQMCYIHLGLKEGFDVSVYAKPEFNSLQMYEIYSKLVEDKIKLRNCILF